MGRYIKLFYLLIFFIFFICSCAPAKFEAKEMSELKFEKTPQYNINLDDIPKPSKIQRQFLNGDFKLTKNIDEAKYVLLVPKEYAKIEALLDIIIAYKKIIKEQEVLINSDINIINSLKEFVELERLKAKEYRNLWVDSENAYREERYLHKMDNAINKGTLSLISIGSLIAIILLI